MTGLMVAVIIVVVSIGWFLGLDAVLAFWILYILTRPLGASIGDYLSQPTNHGGLGLGATLTSVIFLGGILIVVAYLTVSKADAITGREPAVASAASGSSRRQTVVVIGLIVVVLGGGGYVVRRHTLEHEIAASMVSAGGTFASPLGDLAVFRVITDDTLSLLTAGDQNGATTRVDDLEFEWDNAQSVMRPRDGAAWESIDGKIDTVLRELRATSPDPAAESTALTSLVAALR